MTSEDTILDPVSIARSTEPLPIGAKAGPWRIERELGRGGMGAIYAVVHDTIGKRAALKVGHPIASGQLTRAIIEASLVNEGRAVNRVHHPAIVDIFDAGTLPDLRPYLVMEQLDGVSLGDHVARERLAPDVAIHILLELCGALAAAHAVGVIHRDLKPDNVFLVANPLDVGKPRVKLLDWGISTLASDTTGERFFGTPDYIAPERVRGEPSTTHSDVYSLGIMAYELFLEQLPFEADTDAQVALMHVGRSPPVPGDVWPGIPPVLERLLLAMLAKQPGHRPELAEIARRLVRARDELARCTEELARSTPPPTIEHPVLRSRTHRIATALAAIVGLAMVAGYWRDAGSTTARPARVEPPPVQPSIASPAPLPELLVAIATPAPVIAKTRRSRHDSRRPPARPRIASSVEAPRMPAEPRVEAPAITPAPPATAAMIARQYERVGASLLALVAQRGPTAAAPVATRYRLIQIQQAMTTHERRIATAAELDRLALQITDALAR